MNQSLVLTLMRKDWDLSWKPLLGFIALGFIGLAIIVFGHTQFTFIVGGVLLITSIVILGCFLVQATIAGERKEQNLAFVMSLPVTIREYSWAKILFCFGAYLMVWGPLVGASVYVVMSSPIPDGMMALFAPMFLELLCTLALMVAVSIITESMQATVVIMTAGNIGVSLFMFSILRINDVARQFTSATMEWTPSILILIGSELLFIVATLALTLYLQSRKTDFI